MTPEWKAAAAAYHAERLGARPVLREVKKANGR